MSSFSGWENNLYPSLIDNINYIVDNIPTNGVLYDIGANTGLLSEKVLEKRPDVSIVLFEPVKKYYDCIVERFKSYDNIIIHNVALIDEDREVVMSLDAENLGWNTISTIQDYGEKETVIGTSLYNVYKKYNIPLPDLIKIDAEQSEYLVIEGAKKLFELHLSSKIMIEIGIYKDNSLWNKEYEMIEYLFSLGYKRFESQYNTTIDAKFEL